MMNRVLTRALSAAAAAMACGAGGSVAVSGATMASYAYDGNFKRVKSVAGGKTVYSVYSKLSGGLIYRDEATDAKTTDYLAAWAAPVKRQTA